MLCAVVVCVALGAAATVLAVQQPWLGLRLSADLTAVRIDATQGPAAAIRAPAVLEAVGGRQVRPLDLTPEPDVLETFDAVYDFRRGQDALAGALDGPVVLQVREADAAPRAVTVSPRATRPLVTLPAVFWVQIAVGSVAFLIGAWVWTLKPMDWPARLFALSSVAMVFATHSAAVYSTRELALPADVFRALSVANGAGAGGFGAAMIGLFLLYPRRLVKTAWVALPAAVAFAWWSVWALEIAPVPTLSQFLMMTEMLLILVILGVQVWATRNSPIDRSVLTYLGLSVAVGAGAFVFSNAAPVLLGFGSVVNQGYAFVSFLIIYVGLALGLRRYRLFEMGEWAFRILFYTGAALAFLALDAALIWGLQLAPGNALGLAMISIAFLYLPLRDVLWRRTVARRKVREDELFEQVMQTAFANSPAERAERWVGIIERLFAPLEITPLDAGPPEPQASDEGLTLTLPATADAPALMLRFPFEGRGMFAPTHLKLAQQLTRLMRHADQNRDAFERGAARERKRIARDLHDDVGARLLSGLHKPDVDQTREVLREAIADMRTIVGGLTGAALPLSKVVAEMRHETGRRLEGAGIDLAWPISDVDADETPLTYRVYKNWGSAHREIVTNAIKHAGASRVSVGIERLGDLLVLTIADDGKGLSGRKAGGNGLGNVEKRMAELGGCVDYPTIEIGHCVKVTIPLNPAPIPSLEPSGIHA